jgi:hypothetical protein
MSLNGLPGRKRLVAPWAGFITTSMTPAAPARIIPEDQDSGLLAQANATAILQASTGWPRRRSTCHRRTSAMVRAESWRRL